MCSFQWIVPAGNTLLSMEIIRCWFQKSFAKEDCLTNKVSDSKSPTSKNLPNYAKSCKTTLRRDFHVFKWEACKSFKFCLNVHWSESVLYYKKPWVLFWLHNSCRSGRNKLSFHNTALIPPPLLPRAALSFTVFIVSMYNKVSIW